MSNGLPSDLEQILSYIAQSARGYGNRLKWNEVAKLKSDMMVVRHRWTPDRAPVELVRARCLELGMTAEDTSTVTDLLRRTQSGRRLVPQSSYKGFAFKPPVA